MKSRCITLPGPRGHTPAPRSRLVNFLEGSAAGLAAKFVPVMIGFWLTPFILSRVGREAFGLYALACSLIAWFALLDLGLTPGLKVYLARCSAQPDAETTNRYASSTFFLQLGVALLVLLAGSAAANWIPAFFSVPERLENQAGWLAVLLVAACAVSLGTQTFSALLVSQQHLKRDHLIRLTLPAIRAALVVLLLMQGYSLAALGVAQLLAVTVAATFAFRSAYRLTPGLRLRPSLISPSELRVVSGCGMWFSAGGAAGLLINGADNIVAAKLVSLEAVTVLTVTASAYLTAESALSLVVNNARPALGQLFGENRPAAILRAYRQMLLGSAGLGLVAACSIWAANKAFVTAWVGPEHYGGAWLDGLLGLNCVLALAILPSRALLAAHLTVRPQTLSRLVEGLLNLGLGLWLTWRLGLVGTVLSTSLAALATSFWYLPRLALRALGTDARWLGEVAGKLGGFALLLMPAAWLGRLWASTAGGYPGAITAGLFTAAWGAMLGWTLLLDSWVKARFVEWLGSTLLPRRAPAGAPVTVHAASK